MKDYIIPKEILYTGLKSHAHLFQDHYDETHCYLMECVKPPFKGQRAWAPKPYIADYGHIWKVLWKPGLNCRR